MATVSSPPIVCFAPVWNVVPKSRWLLVKTSNTKASMNTCLRGTSSFSIN